MGKKKLSSKEIIERFIKTHNNKYDYSLMDYKSLSNKIKIICKKHGVFEQRPSDHIKGNGCSKCSGNVRNDREYFIQKSKEIHKEKYDYSLVEYINNCTKVIILCPIHGEFKQQPNNHISGQGCKECKKMKISLSNTNDKNEIYDKLKKIHKNLEIDITSYANNRSFLNCRCKFHGNFIKSYQSLLKGGGCIKCSGKKSKGEVIIENYLLHNNIDYIPQYKFNDCIYKRELLFDFYLPKYNLCIEFNGKQHYYMSSKFGIREFEEGKIRDEIKIKYCNDNNIPLLIIKWNENILNKIKDYFL